MSLIKLLQEKMIERNITYYIVPTSDYHNSEYIADHFKARELLTGFTGSQGTLLVTQDGAYLWVDGRYFIQAELQTQDKDITIMKMGQPHVPTLIEFIAQNANDGDLIGFDGKVMNTSFVLNLQNQIPKAIKLAYVQDLVGEIWENRPILPFSLLYELSLDYTGASYEEKLQSIKIEMNKHNADVHILSSLEDQAWLYNLRANDIVHTPVFLAFTMITQSSTTLFIDTRKINAMVEKYLDEHDIIVKPYHEIYSAVKQIKSKNLLMNLNKINYYLYAACEATNDIINKPDPTLLLKSIKNSTEIKNIKEAHIKDGVAFTKFMCYIKNNFGVCDLSELSVTKILEDYRKLNQGFIDLSFNTICAYKEHGAMMHYSATPESNYQLEGAGFLLIDSGGHYIEGTTDITRTLALGKITDKMKIHFTTVLKSVIALSKAQFLKGCTGQNLDILARGPIWDLLIDYKCGTGHGVGYLLSVHEAPNGFRWQIVPERNDSAKLEAGMITTNEPGIYLEGEYGIRTENELLCVEAGQSEFGEFLRFETITYAPIDLDAIKPSLLTKPEKEWINNYHEMVYNTLKPYLSNDEIVWLEKYTKKI